MLLVESSFENLELRHVLAVRWPQLVMCLETTLFVRLMKMMLRYICLKGSI